VKRPALVVFDLDGTLIDSRADLANAANATLARLGLPTLAREAIISYVGDGLDALIRRCLTLEHENLFEKAKGLFIAHYREHCLDNTALLPGAREALDALKGKSRLAVLTNKAEPYAVKILKGLGVASYFEEIVGEKAGQVPKPDPTVLKEIMKRLGAPPNRTLMVGDGKNDILVSKAAGCVSCLVAGFPEEKKPFAQLCPDFIIHGLAELPGLFKD